jgi:hypothetical protein
MIAITTPQPASMEEPGYALLRIVGIWAAAALPMGSLILAQSTVLKAGTTVPCTERTRGVPNILCAVPFDTVGILYNACHGEAADSDSQARCHVVTRKEGL